MAIFHSNSYCANYEQMMLVSTIHFASTKVVINATVSFIQMLAPMLNMKNIRTLIIIITTLYLQSCGSLLDITGKGAKTKCLKLLTDNLTVDCNCLDKQIATMTIYSNRNSKENFGVKTIDTVFSPTTKLLRLPISKELADKSFLQIELHLTNTHHRESYFIKTKPGDFSKTQNIYSRYISH